MQAQAHARNMIQEQNRIVREWVVMAPQAGRSGNFITQFSNALNPIKSDK